MKFLVRLSFRNLERKLNRLKKETEDHRRRHRVSHYALLGMFTATWAKSEYALEGCNLMIFQHYGGSTLENELPRALDKKIKFLRRSHQKLPALTPFDSVGVALADRFAAMRDDRHDLIHGIMSGELGTEETKLFRSLPGARHPTKRERTFGYSEIERTIDRTVALANDTIDHLHLLIDLLPERS